MAGRSVAEILAPEVIAERISRIDFPGTTISRLLGFSVANFMGANPTGAVMDWALRTGQYDIFDVSRKIATGRVPGTAPSYQKPQKVGSVRFTLPRSAETIPLSYEALNNQRALGGPASEVDRNGMRYIDSQLEYLGQRFANLIEFQAAAMCRGSYTFTQNGDDLEHTFSGGENTIDYQIPAGNKTQLDMLGAGSIIGASWATDTTDIPLHLLNINKAFVQLTGQGLEHIITRGQVWNNVLNNTKVKAQAGTANPPYDVYDRKGSGEFTCRLKSIPWLEWHICDYGLDVWDGSAYTYTQLIPDDHIICMPKPDPRWVEYIRGMETVVEGPGGRQSDQYGFYSYSYATHEPAGVNLSAVFNGMPSLKRPKAIAFGDTTP